MHAFERVNDFEMQSVEGGGILVVAAAAGVVIGITLGVGILVYKSASDFVDATQQQNSGGGKSK